MLSMFAVGGGGGETKHPSPVDGLVCQADIGKPVENAVNRHAVNWLPIVREHGCDFRMAQGKSGCLYQGKNSCPRRSRTRTRVAYGFCNV